MVPRVFWTVLFVGITATLARAETLNVPAGTTIHSRLLSTLSTKLNFQGDTFLATVSEPVVVGGETVVPLGATIEGRIAYLDRPGRIRGVAEMRLSPEKMVFPDGRTLHLSAVLLSAYGAEDARVEGEEGLVKGPTSRKSDLKIVGTGAAAGGVIGTIASGGSGLILGGIIGGSAGLADRLLRRGRDLTLPSGTQLNYQLTRDLIVEQASKRQAATRASAGVTSRLEP